MILCRLGEAPARRSAALGVLLDLQFPPFGPRKP